MFPTPSKPAKPARRSQRLNALLGVVLALLVAALIAMWLVSSEPAFYGPAMARSRQNLLNDAYDFNVKLQDFVSYNILSDRAKPLELTDNEVNGYLAAVNDKEIWEKLPIRFESWRREFTSEWLHDVRVEFADERVTVAGRVTWHDMDFILSVSGAVDVDAKGQARLHVSRIRAGRLWLPKCFFRGFLKDIEDRPLPARINRWHLKAVEVVDGKARLVGNIDN